MFAPGKEPGARPGIGAARVGVANVGGEEFDITPARVIADVGDHPCFDRPEPVNLRSYLTTASKSGSGMGYIDGSFFCQPAPVRTHFASVVRQRLGRGAVGREAKPAGQR